MTTATRAPRSQTSAGHRRISYVVAILVNGAVLYAANRRPGWDAMPFLSVVRVLVALGIVGSAIGIVVALVTLVRGGPRPTDCCAGRPGSATSSPGSGR